MSFEEVDYRPVFGRVLAVIMGIVCAAGLGSLVWSGPGDLLRYGWPIALVAVVAWALFWKPRLHIQVHGITVVNPFRTFFVPWPAIHAIDTRYSLSLQTARRRVSVWATPAPGRHRLFGLSRADFDGVSASARGAHGSLRPSDASSVPSGNLAQVIRQHWDRLESEGAFAHGEDPEAATVTWHWASLTTVALLTAATVIGLMV